MNIVRKDGSVVNDGINNNTYELLFIDKKEIPKEKHGKKENKLIYSALDNFTLHEKRNILVKLHDKLLKLLGCNIDYISYDEETECFRYIDGNEDIPFNRITDFIFNEEAKKTLYSRKRSNQCHFAACGIADTLGDAYVVTGFSTIGTKRILHSVVEVTDDDNENTYIIDWTENIRMLKSDYYRIYGFEELSRFKSDSIEEDMLYADYFNLGCKPYVCFRDEFMRDLEKNKSLFKK